MQNHSETEEQLLFTATESFSMETNFAQSESISFPAATLQPEHVDVESLVNFFNLKQWTIFNAETDWAREKVK